MSHLEKFTTFTFPKYRVNWHHKLICSKLDEVITGKVKRLMIFTPPRHGKTELVGRRFPAFAFGRDPEPDAPLAPAVFRMPIVLVTNRQPQFECA